MIKRVLATFFVSESPSFRQERELSDLGHNRGDRSDPEVAVVDHYEAEDDYDTEGGAVTHQRWKGRTVHCYTQHAIDIMNELAANDGGYGG